MSTKADGETAAGVAVLAGRRSRQPVRRPRRVEFSLTEEEYRELGGAAAQAGLARGAYAAEAALAVARGSASPGDSHFRNSWASSSAPRGWCGGSG